MSDRPRYYLTTAIAYANNKPGLHTLYEVIGADVIARWHRMIGDDTRFLTGTDEHSINIAQSAIDEGRSPRAFVDEKVGYFNEAEDALAITPDRFIRTTDPDHVRAAQEMVRRAHANGDIYLGTYEGWYCPNEGFRNATDVQETARGTICPNHPDVPLQWLTERNWFFRLSAYQERLERLLRRPSGLRPARLPAQRDARLHPRRPRGLLDLARADARRLGDPVPDRRERRDARCARTASWDPEAGVIYVWYDALINYITGAGFPDDPDGVRALVAGRPARHRQGHRPVPHDLLAGDAVERRARGAAPRLGPRLAAGRPGRADEQEPRQLPRPERLRRRVRRRTGRATSSCARSRSTATPRSRGTRSSAATTPTSPTTSGTSLNRTVSMTNRYLDGERPGAAAGRRRRRWPRAGRTRSGCYRRALEGCLLHDALAELWEFVGGANKVVDAEQPWVLAKAAKAGDEAAGERLRGVLGDLLEACRLVGLAVAPFMPGIGAAGPRPARLRPTPYAADGNGGPPILDELAWGAIADEAGRVDRARAALPAARHRDRPTPA